MENNEAIFVLLGAEIQGTVHYAMTVKNGLYDFIAYDDQVDEIVSKNRTDENIKLRPGGEYLYGFRKDDRADEP